MKKYLPLSFSCREKQMIGLISYKGLLKGVKSLDQNARRKQPQTASNVFVCTMCIALNLVSDFLFCQSCARLPPVVKCSFWRLQPWPTSPSSTAWPVRSSCSSTPSRSCCRPAETARESTLLTQKTRYTSAFRCRLFDKTERRSKIMS